MLARLSQYLCIRMQISHPPPCPSWLPSQHHSKTSGTTKLEIHPGTQLVKWNKCTDRGFSQKPPPSAHCRTFQGAYLITPFEWVTFLLPPFLSITQIVQDAAFLDAYHSNFFCPQLSPRFFPNLHVHCELFCCCWCASSFSPFVRLLAAL